ncbi:MAG: hypothetical protein P8Y29_02450, partial [Gemmatimonadota bacterium]
MASSGADGINRRPGCSKGQSGQEIDTSIHGRHKTMRTKLMLLVLAVGGLLAVTDGATVMGD